MYNEYIMKNIYIDKNPKKVVEYLLTKFNKLRKSTIYKALRNKDIRVNDVKISENVDLNIGDELTVYITDEYLYGTTLLTDNQIVYNDENIIIVNKPQNMLVVSEKDEVGLDTFVSKHLNSNVFPCHRLDRNTSRFSYLC